MSLKPTWGNELTVELCDLCEEVVVHVSYQSGNIIKPVIVGLVHLEPAEECYLLITYFTFTFSLFKSN